MTKEPWYSGAEKTVDIRLVGDIPLILDTGDLLHERTPFLSALYYRHVNEGLLYTRIDVSALARLKNLAPYRDNPALSYNFIEGFEIVKNGPFRHLVHRWTLADRDDIAPCCETIPSLPIFPRTSSDERTRLYRCVDTPEAHLARLFANHMPTYTYRTQQTYLTYVLLSRMRKHRLLRVMREHYPDFTLEKRFHLPYESTAPESPIQRLIEAQDYL